MSKIAIKKIKLAEDGELNINEELGKISNPYDVENVFKKYLEGVDREYMACICLSTKNKVLNISTIAIGSLNSATVHPREVFKVAILSNSASIILCHNHPSGDTKPSKEDINITLRIKEAGRILGIELLDHLIIGEDKTISLNQEGYI